MAYDIRMVKLVTGETSLGKYNEVGKCLDDPAVLQTVPTQQGVQMMLMPFGYPFDNEFTGNVSYTHVLYEYKTCPEELKNKYLEACSNLTLSSGGLGSALNLKGKGGSGLIT
ncbi:hypothetical protein LJB82_03600 [Desulfovibrio sp. OttesenSCG-928-M16]|nr:hypothetical protein [Desulfovibrio sp. OttesenSCG-928-M16]